jgi:hypothetical protein
MFCRQIIIPKHFVATGKMRVGFHVLWFQVERFIKMNYSGVTVVLIHVGVRQVEM